MPKLAGGIGGVAGKELRRGAWRYEEDVACNGFLFLRHEELRSVLRAGELAAGAVPAAGQQLADPGDAVGVAPAVEEDAALRDWRNAA